MDAVARSERKERSPQLSSKFTLRSESERADAGRDGEICLARQFFFTNRN